MNLNKGFTLIELMIVMAIIGIIAAVLVPVITGKKPNGMSYTEADGTRCLSGYRFYKDRQILDKNGSGISCDSTSTPAPSAGPQPLK